jgi:hypothetical protein
MYWSPGAMCHEDIRYGRDVRFSRLNGMKMERLLGGKFCYCSRDSNRYMEKTITRLPHQRLAWSPGESCYTLPLVWDGMHSKSISKLPLWLLPEEEVQYMEQPAGFEEVGKEDWVWKLQRGQYGMKQSGRIWNTAMNERMIAWGFTRLT